MFTWKNVCQIVQNAIFNVPNTDRISFDPEADFSNTQKIIEHYETLSQIFNHDINVIQKTANPIRELRGMENVLQIVPFTHDMKKTSIFKILSTKIEDYLLSIEKHPKILVPVFCNDCHKAFLIMLSACS